MELAPAIARAQQGEEAAYRWLFEHYKTSTLRLIQSMSRSDPDAAQDVLQNTFIRAFKSIRSLEHPDRFEAWLVRIARRETLRHLARRRPLEPLSAEAESNIDQELDRLQRVEQEKLLLVIRKTAEQVKPKSIKETALRYYFGPKTTTEAVAQELGVPHATVRKRLFLFRKKLRHRLLGRGEN